MMAAAGPVDTHSRIPELDAIRGFALFGVLWMNLNEATGEIIPAADVIHLAPVVLENALGFVSKWLMSGRAQALFSMLFGFGFALFLQRAERTGSNGQKLYLRRIGFLLVLGVLHTLLVFYGDILHSYALVGFALLLTRRWSGRTLFVVGGALSVLSAPLTDIITDLVRPGENAVQIATIHSIAADFYRTLQQRNYARFVAEDWQFWTRFIYATPIGFSYTGWIFGRFLIGSWLFRQEWAREPSRHAARFRVLAAVLLPTGLLLGLLQVMLDRLGVADAAPRSYALTLLLRTADMVQALGYAALIVVLYASPPLRRMLSGLEAVGRMALSNYLLQSLAYVFILDGFGLGLLRYVGQTFCLATALVVFGLQIAFSRWWLQRYRFGPFEWLWRSFTYDSWQPMRRRVGIVIEAGSG